MASTYSTNLALELIGTGDQSGTWGNTTNTNLGTLIEQAISGYVTQAITDGADTTITIPNGATGVARNMAIEMTGALTAARNLIVPANKKLYFIYNNTTGGFAVTVKVSGQTGVSVPNGKKMLLVSNGTDIVEAVNAHSTLAVAGAATFGSTTSTTGVASFADGTVGTPGLNFSSDPDNGFYRIGTNNWAAAAAGAKALEFKSGGQVVTPLNPTFAAWKTAVSTDVTGDGADWIDVVFDTEDYDIGSNYNTSTGVFTAPVSGTYLLSAEVLMTGFGGTYSEAVMRLVTSNNTYYSDPLTSSSTLNIGSFATRISMPVYMDAADTATIGIIAYRSPSNKTVDVYGQNNARYTWFSGALIG